MSLSITDVMVGEIAGAAADEVVQWRKGEVRTYNAFGLTVCVQCVAERYSECGFSADLWVAGKDRDMSDECYDSRDVEASAIKLAGRFVLASIASGKARVVEVES